MTAPRTIPAQRANPPTDAAMLVRQTQRDQPPGNSSQSQANPKADHFHSLAVPHLDDVYTLARYLLRSPTDAEDATQECYLRAFRHFHTFRGGPIRPWLLAILRNVCRAEFARRGALALVPASEEADIENTSEGLWGEQTNSPETEGLRQFDKEAAQRLIAQLPEPFREVIVLREINDLSYREIAEVVSTPVGTVMSRLARGRSLLRQAWLAEEKGPSA
jgi:RNA polymerase sigma-70 factor, ECF subfamily